MFDVIVIGAGHAGVEAAHAVASLVRRCLYAASRANSR
jgi:tRNA U34 5-carboxymethylaminomethyl modifying enzyme MnmG/GidA